VFDDTLDPVLGYGVTCAGVTVRFGGVAALAEATFSIASRELAAVVGPNGAGKSTLLNAISGLAPSGSTGSIILGSDEVLGMAPASIARLGVGRSFQNPPLIDNETVLENVLVGEHLRLGYRVVDQIVRRRLVAQREAQARERALAVLAFMGLEDLRFERAGSLPYGIRKLVDIARAIVSGPRLLLLDEPTSGLDRDEQRKLSQIVKEFHLLSGATVVVVEHHIDIVREIATKVVGMESGTVIATGSPAEVLDSEAFRQALVGAPTDIGTQSSPVGEKLSDDALVRTVSRWVSRR
jgi:ABC-type branched-subunit amino acid transport system ATPase component